jgi:hypothetical protein
MGLDHRALERSTISGTHKTSEGDKPMARSTAGTSPASDAGELLFGRPGKLIDEYHERELTDLERTLADSNATRDQKAAVQRRLDHILRRDR